MITRRRVILAVLALFLAGVGYVAWTLVGLPPVKYHLRYGLDPYCEPTGEQVTHEGVEFVEIGPGIFRMGSDELDDRGDWLGRVCAPLGLPWGKHPQHAFELPPRWMESRLGFWIATTEITNTQYERFRPKQVRSEASAGDREPVVDVSWVDAQRFCAWLAERSGRPIRLPTEAEWECACRAGSTHAFSFGNDRAELAAHAWFKKNAGIRAHEVATKSPNRWGLYDMHGNVWEWCADAVDGNHDPPTTDLSEWSDMEGNPGSLERSGRGGSWDDSADDCRASLRYWYRPLVRYDYFGFRPAFSNPEDE